jgi:hypothetical protein
MNCVSKTEGQWEPIQDFQNLRKDGQTDRQTDRETNRHGVTNSEDENPSLINFSRTV